MDVINLAGELGSYDHCRTSCVRNGYRCRRFCRFWSKIRICRTGRLILARREGVSPVLRCRAGLLRLLRMTLAFLLISTLGGCAFGPRALEGSHHLYNDSIKLVGEELPPELLAEERARALRASTRGRPETPTEAPEDTATAAPETRIEILNEAATIWRCDP